MAAPGGATDIDLAAQVEGGFHAARDRDAEEERLFQEFKQKRAQELERTRQIMEQQAREKAKQKAAYQLAVAKEARQEEEIKAAERAKFAGILIGEARVLLVAGEFMLKEPVPVEAYSLGASSLSVFKWPQENEANRIIFEMEEQQRFDRELRRVRAIPVLLSTALSLGFAMISIDHSLSGEFPRESNLKKASDRGANIIRPERLSRWTLTRNGGGALTAEQQDQIRHAMYVVINSEAGFARCA